MTCSVRRIFTPPTPRSPKWRSGSQSKTRGRGGEGASWPGDFSADWAAGPLYRAGEAGLATRRSVDGSGRILETTYNEEGEVVDEEEVGDVTDLPVETEYLDAQGRLMSLASDELGNTFEWVTDEELGTLEARIVRTSG